MQMSMREADTGYRVLCSYRLGRAGFHFILGRPVCGRRSWCVRDCRGPMGKSTWVASVLGKQRASSTTTLLFNIRMARG